MFIYIYIYEVYINVLKEKNIRYKRGKRKKQQKGNLKLGRKWRKQ